MKNFLLNFIFLLYFNFSYSAFTTDFGNWLSLHFGENIRQNLERLDLGDNGSFGGKINGTEIANKQPVIFVHGVSSTAGDKMKLSANFFKKHSYNNYELYGTTYANGAQGNPLQWAQYHMSCHYVKLIRALIVAVRLYTGRSVDVVSYSLGVPISRKAILGGRCVDTGEDLGHPLTKFIDTFVGVAGPNHGISLQMGVLSLPGCALSAIPICNQLTGLYSGNCPYESSFLQDINSNYKYEGKYIYSIHSKADHVVGYKVCNYITTQIPGQTGEKVYIDKNHDDVYYHSYNIQLRMVRDHLIP
ncbi:Lipase EstA/Esterase EstB family-containing protein [Strongyloides ratti]|uniref:Lipase EstA/Esterase EstB family-containing protein n=1 Tax=Strongyloides ratti TaxID=34506 RepID=A0A090MNX6_STRRB|nr:Lipase EstA/Esterase EstB family-containing protein [Strongyloides ratti]CEF59771.1 Lipase EstA/Esterase EstB family-containing protein [Strongyloides ratti]